jgi:flagellin-like hook-associated protein FlgL
MSGITLTTAMRSNLLTLQGTQSMIGATQNRLATGLRVNSAVDDPRNFFQSQALNARASDLSRRLDGMGVAIKTIEAADKGIKAMSKVAENMAAIIKQAQDATTDAARATLLTQFNELRTQLTNLAEDSGFNGVNLLGGNNLIVNFNEDASNTATVTAVDWRTTPIGLTAPATGDWATGTTGDGNLTTASTAVNTAINTLRTQAATFGSSLTMVKIREDFTKEMVNTLKAGADGLVLADQNEEAANLLALQTRQQLGIQALSLASQSQQGILRLFG